jgi:hypothetical protein
MLLDKKTIAIDFDGCLCKDEYPNIGAPIAETIERYFAERAQGAHVILWTSRHGASLHEALTWCSNQGIVFDAVNENLPELIELYGDTRKVSADEYWDDKAVQLPQRWGCGTCKWYGKRLTALRTDEETI